MVELELAEGAAVLCCLCVRAAAARRRRRYHGIMLQLLLAWRCFTPVPASLGAFVQESGLELRRLQVMLFLALFFKDAGCAVGVADGS